MEKILQPKYWCKSKQKLIRFSGLSQLVVSLRTLSTYISNSINKFDDIGLGFVKVLTFLVYTKLIN